MKLHLIAISSLALTTSLQARVNMDFDEEGRKGAPLPVTYEEKSSLKNKTQPSELPDKGFASAVDREDREAYGSSTTDQDVEPMTSLTNDKIAGTGGGVAHLDPALVKDLTPSPQKSWWERFWGWILSFFGSCPKGH